MIWFRRKPDTSEALRNAAREFRRAGVAHAEAKRRAVVDEMRLKQGKAPWVWQ